MGWLNKIVPWNRHPKVAGRQDLPAVNSLVMLHVSGERRPRRGVIFNRTPDGLVWILFPEGGSLPCTDPGSEIEIEYQIGENPVRLVTQLAQVTTDVHPISGVTLTRFGLRPSGRVETVQRRKFSRLDLVIPVTFFNIVIPPGYEVDPDVQLDTTLKWRLSKPKKCVTGQLRDISAGGCSIMVRDAVTIGDEIYSQLTLENEFVQTAARVVQVTPSGAENRAGVQFVGMDDDLKEFLERFVDDESTRRRRTGKMRTTERTG